MGLGDTSRTLEGNSGKSPQTVSRVFPEFFRNFFRKFPAILGVWLSRSWLQQMVMFKRSVVSCMLDSQANKLANLRDLQETICLATLTKLAHLHLFNVNVGAGKRVHRGGEDTLDVGGDNAAREQP